MIAVFNTIITLLLIERMCQCAIFAQKFATRTGRSFEWKFKPWLFSLHRNVALQHYTWVVMICYAINLILIFTTYI